jgi:hypothetical protein
MVTRLKGGSETPPEAQAAAIRGHSGIRVLGSSGNAHYAASQLWRPKAIGRQSREYWGSVLIVRARTAPVGLTRSGTGGDQQHRGVERKKAANKELEELVAATGSSLMNLQGLGRSGAARLLVDVGDVTRFATRDHFASWNGTAPIDASSGDQVRHRLSRAGDRQINRVLHIMATVQLRNPTEGRDYYDRKVASGKGSMEAMRCLKRRLSDIVYRHMVNDAIAHAMTGPGGQRGTTTGSSATGSHPIAGSSDKPLPRPANPTLPPARLGANPTAASTASPRRRRAGAVKVERPTGQTTLTATSATAHSRPSRPRA